MSQANPLYVIQWIEFAPQPSERKLSSGLIVYARLGGQIDGSSPGLKRGAKVCGGFDPDVAHAPGVQSERTGKSRVEGMLPLADQQYMNSILFDMISP